LDARLARTLKLLGETLRLTRIFYTLKGARMARILLVDDYPEALDVLSLYLRLCGFEALAAADGRTALTLTAEQHPDAAVLDLELPDMTGLELARHLRAAPDTAFMPLIALTGHSSSRRIDEAYAAGFNLVLVKPCDPERLCAELRRLLEPSEPASMPADALNRHGDTHPL
jgi:two-component system OmpR family response regulator